MLRFPPAGKSRASRERMRQRRLPAAPERPAVNVKGGGAANGAAVRGGAGGGERGTGIGARNRPPDALYSGR